MKKIALFYWPKGGSVNHISNLIREKAVNVVVDVFSVDELVEAVLNNYDGFIFGGSTVGADHWTNDETASNWTGFFKALSAQKEMLSGKTVALFGLGNGVMYPDHFVDEMVAMKQQLLNFNVNFVGEVSSETYDFNESESLENNKFMGLAIDEDNEPEQSEKRVVAWLGEIEGQF